MKAEREFPLRFTFFAVFLFHAWEEYDKIPLEGNRLPKGKVETKVRKTKIVCTLGPATDREGVLREMLLAGMNVARFNFSHGSHEEHKARLDQLKALREELDLPVAAMLDTKGPEIRLKNFENDAIRLKTGQEFTLTT